MSEESAPGERLARSGDGREEGCRVEGNREEFNRGASSEDVLDDPSTKESTFDPSQVLKKTPKSMCWQFYGFKKSASNTPDLTKVVCKLCDKTLPYSGATTNLNNHIKINHAKEVEATETKSEQKLDKNKNSIGNITHHFKKISVVKWPKSSERWKKVTMAIAKWCVKDTRPVQIVEDEGFIRLMDLVQPEYEVPVPTTITNYIDTLYKQEVGRVKKELEEIEFVAKTTDGGSASNGSSFHETGVHGITEDFEMKYFTLSVRQAKEKHTAENYRENTDKVEEEFGVKNKVVMTTTNNEAKMRKAYKDDERTGCLSHLIHSSVDQGNTEEKVVNSSILKQRKVIKKHNTFYVALLPTTPTRKDDDYRLSVLRMGNKSFRPAGISSSSGHDRLPKLLTVASGRRCNQYIYK